MSTPDSPPPARPRYTAGQIAMMVIGVILLLPGLCSLFFIVALTLEKRGNPLSDPYVQAFAVVWAICLAITAIGVAMIIIARKRASR